LNFAPLPDDWPDHRDTLWFLAAHLLAQSRQRHDGLFDLVPLPGGFGTPPVGSDRQRARLVGGSLFVERISGDHISNLRATTDVATVAGSSLHDLCGFVGFVPDPDFWVGDDTPSFRDPHEPIPLDGLATSILGEWFLLGQRAIDEVVASLPDPAATVGRLWPEHFDYGIDLAATADIRCNLGAAAGDGFHQEPYLYVGPFGFADGRFAEHLRDERAERPPGADYWNAPFGSLLGFGDLDAADDPVRTAIEFFMTGIAALRAMS
jgi:hypothetical protein